MKIVLIGPVYPYKGGIAHYTSLLCQALRQKHEVTMVSYKMQYPKFLFKKEQCDYSNRNFEVAQTHYWLHTANPFNIIKTAHKINSLKPDAVILQWWHPYFAPCYFLLSLFLKKVSIIFTCHNVFPHERFPMDSFLTKLALKKGSGYIVQSRQDKSDLLTIKPDAHCILTPHPTYNAFKLKGMSKDTARTMLQIPSTAPVLLFFGFVREYKGLQVLINALPRIREVLPDISLWIVGDFGDDKQDYLDTIDKKQLHNNIKLVEGYIPDTDVEQYFAASDLVVLPYLSATQSGIVQIAYGFEKPVVVTNVGGLPDVVEHGKTGYVIPSRNPDALAGAVIAFFQRDYTIDWAANIRSKSKEFSWETMTEQIEKLLSSGIST